MGDWFGVSGTLGWNNGAMNRVKYSLKCLGCVRHLVLREERPSPPVSTASALRSAVGAAAADEEKEGEGPPEAGL